MKIIAIGTPSLKGSGADRRSYMTLLNYSTFDTISFLHIPFKTLAWKVLSSKSKPIILENLRLEVNSLKDAGITINPMLLKILEEPDIIFNDEYIEKFISSKHPYFKWFFHTISIETSKLQKEYISETINATNDFDLVYQMSEPTECVQDAFIISSLTKFPHFIFLQEMPYKIRNLRFYLENLISGDFSIPGSFFREYLNFIHTKSQYSQCFSSGNLKLVSAPSQSCFLSKGFRRYAKRNDVPLNVPYPENAIEDLNRDNHNGKERDCIFYARMIPEKGIFDLYKIMEKLPPHIKLKVFGKFDNVSTKRRFTSLLENFENVEYRGFANRDELVQEIQNSKVLIYPSHADAFPLTIIEALKLGTSVVAYLTPGLEPYNNIPAVSLVPEYDYVGMASAVKKVIGMTSEEYKQIHMMPEVLKFVKDHGSWKKVAESEINDIRKILIDSSKPIQRRAFAEENPQ